MAHSVVKVTDIKDDELNDSLLLLVGEDGTVTPDQHTVETFLKQRNGPTNIQIMKINKSEKQNIDITVDNVTYMPDAENEEVVKTEYEMDEVARNLYNFRLDHDYTQLLSPYRSSAAQEEDDLVKTLTILDGPDVDPSLSPLPISEPPPLILASPKVERTKPRVKIIQSITLTPANTQLNLINKNMVQQIPSTVNIIKNIPLILQTETSAAPVTVVSTPVVTPTETTKSTIGLAPETVVDIPTTPVTTKSRAKTIKVEPKTILRQERAKPVKPKPKIVKEVIEESEEEYEDEDLFFEMEDDENDSDFDFEEELKSKQIPKRAGRRTRSESKSSPKFSKLTPKSRSKEKVSKEMKEDIPKSELQKPVEKPVEKSPEQKPEQQDVKQTEKPPEKKPPKKEKKVPKPILDDFALFSTPDIIRRVGGKEPTTPSTPEATSPVKPGKITQENRSKSSSENVTSPSKNNRNSLDSKITEKSDKEKHSTSHHHTENKGKDRRISTGELKPKRNSIDERFNKSDLDKSEKHNREKKHEKALTKLSETDPSAVDTEDMPSAEDIRSIIMNEDTKSFTTGSIPLDITNSQNMESNNINLDATGLDLDPSLLDNLNNDEISEDILYQVAQSLVSNPELQNAIDKGINDGVLDPIAVEDNVMNNPTMQEPDNDVIQRGTQIVRPDGRIVVIPPIERPTTRSRNKRKENEKPVFKPVHKPLDEEHVSGNELDSSNDEEEESEDDPNKLWCICNQPHNNRFMICCDTCEEWYHGKCVNITKVMGQQMEAEGKEWICLFCKDPMLKRPQAAARRVRKASRNSRASTDSSSSTSKKADSSSSTVPCVICQKPSRKNSIYCSEACILDHAQGIVRVVVFERSTGNMLTGNKAPHSGNLEQWLKEHPGYEVVRSGGKVVTAKAGNFTQSKLKLVKNPDNDGVSLAVQKKGVSLGVLKHSPKHTDGQPHVKPNLKATITGIKLANKKSPGKELKTKLIQAQPITKPPTTPTPTKPKIVQTTLTKTPQPTPTKQKTPNTKEKDKEGRMSVKKPKTPQQETPSTPQAKPQENIRENVQKTVFEQLMNRLKGCEDIKLTEDEVKNISTEIELQLHKCFGDTGQKYRNKYRSLIFNIKDAKNQTLWRRICEKSINPYELVRLSPDDLASQELAMWREREAKHQLDMIKKSELELLNCNRQYVLKTHKGEQVVEDDRTDKVDNTEVIKSLTEGSTLDAGESKKDLSKERDKKGSSKHSHKDKERNRDRGRDKERKSSKDKEHRSHRSSSRDKDRERDRSRKRSKSRDRRHSDYKKRSRSRDRDRDRHRKSSHKSSRHKKDIISTTDKLDKKSKEILEQLVDNKIVPPLEDRLWKHVPQEDIVPAAAESDSDHEPTSTVTIPTPPHSQEVDEFSIANDVKDNPPTPEKEKEEEQPEERSTSPPPRTQPSEVWRGTINMIDVAQISITAHEVSGDCTGLGKELSENLDIVGRISPDTVWDYIGKMKCSNSKIISLLRLNATNIEEKMPYLALYSYLSSRTRLGVVKSLNKAVKDFYILPLAPQKPIPQALLPINGPGFEESRPALLLGIIVRDKRRRPFIDSGIVPKRTKVETPPLPVPTPAVPTRSYTPPPLKDARVKLPLPPPLATTADEEDEPYSPEDSDPDAPAPSLMPQPVAPSSSDSGTEPDTPSTTYTVPPPTYPAIPGLSTSPSLPSTTLEIQRQMEELNKKIEMQKSEISSMTQNIVSASTEIGSSALANIALPSNLQQILDSIKTIGETTEAVASPPQESSQTDLTIPLMIPKTFTRPLNNVPPPKSELPNDTIPLNLPSKPKIKPPSVNSPIIEEKTSVLSSLSEEELIKKAAEMLGEDEHKIKRKGGKESPKLTPPIKRTKMEVSLPPVPGLEDEIL